MRAKGTPVISWANEKEARVDLIGKLCLLPSEGHGEVRMGHMKDLAVLQRKVHCPEHTGESELLVPKTVTFGH